MIPLAIKPTMPKASTKKRTNVPVLPAFDFQAISPMMNNMKMMKAATPQVEKKSAICSSLNPNTVPPSIA